MADTSSQSHPHPQPTPSPPPPVIPPPDSLPGNRERWTAYRNRLIHSEESNSYANRINVYILKRTSDLGVPWDDLTKVKQQDIVDEFNHLEKKGREEEEAKQQQIVKYQAKQEILRERREATERFHEATGHRFSIVHAKGASSRVRAAAAAADDRPSPSPSPTPEDEWVDLFVKGKITSEQLREITELAEELIAEGYEFVSEKTRRHREQKRFHRQQPPSPSPSPPDDLPDISQLDRDALHALQQRIADRLAELDAAEAEEQRVARANEIEYVRQHGSKIQLSDREAQARWEAITITDEYLEGIRRQRELIAAKRLRRSELRELALQQQRLGLDEQSEAIGEIAGDEWSETEERDYSPTSQPSRHSDAEKTPDIPEPGRVPDLPLAADLQIRNDHRTLIDRAEKRAEAERKRHKKKPLRGTSPGFIALHEYLDSILYRRLFGIPLGFDGTHLDLKIDRFGNPDYYDSGRSDIEPEEEDVEQEESGEQGEQEKQPSPVSPTY